MVVSAHGCAMRSPTKLDAGVPLHFHSQEGRETTAQVVYCQPIGSEQGWRLGTRFERPENFWGLKGCPKDWAQLPAPEEKITPKFPPNKMQVMPPDQAAASVKIALDRIRKQLSDDHLKTVLAELVHPIQAEVTELREKLAQGAKRSRFEVSLSQIPPELEQQLELRLKNYLEPQVVKQAREQSEQVLEAAKTAIDQKTRETHDEFRQQVTMELGTVQKKMHGLSSDVGQNIKEHLNRGIGEIHQEVVDAGTRLKKLSEDLLLVMESNLGQEHDVRSRELEQVRVAVTSESSRLQEQIADLDRRMAALSESAHHLESGLDQRMSRLASDTVRTARGQLEAALEVALNELGTRNAEQLGHQLDEASANLKIIQKEIEGSASGSMKIQVAETLQSFERGMEELAQQSVERWRRSFAGGLNSLLRTLGEQFLQAPADDAGQHSPVKMTAKRYSS